MRHAQSKEDWHRIRLLCSETGDQGSPVHSSRFGFFSELWIGPYQQLIPQWTYVAESGGKVIGYLTGCPDTAAFERLKKVYFTPKLASSVLRGKFGWNKDISRFFKRILGLERNVEQRFSKDVISWIHQRYPAHLHINIHENYRGTGLGQKMIASFLQELGPESGVHVFCGKGPLEFYKKLGFTSLAETKSASGAPVYALGRSTSLLDH